MTPIFIAAFFLAVAVLETSGADWTVLQMKHALLFGGYWDMPRNVSSIKEKTFLKVGHDEELNVDAYSYMKDPRFFLLFDTYGNIAGIRPGYIKSEVQLTAASNSLRFQYDYDKISMFKSGVFWETPIWYTNVLFVHPDKLKAGGREDIQDKVAEGVYVVLDNEWKMIPENENEVLDHGFTKQGYYFGMGQNYFYKVNKNLKCNDFQPFSALYDNGTLHGFGLIPFGTPTKRSSNIVHTGQKWFELISPEKFKTLMPNGPTCAYYWAENFNVCPMHFFLKPGVRSLICPWICENYPRFCNICQSKILKKLTIH